MRTITEHERDFLLKDLDDFVSARARVRPTPKNLSVSNTVVHFEAKPVGSDTDQTCDLDATTDVGHTSPLGTDSTFDDSAAKVGDQLDFDQTVRHALTLALPNRNIVDQIMEIGAGATVSESLEFVLLLAGDYDEMYRSLQTKVSAITTSESSDAYFEQTLELQERVQRIEADLDEAESRLDREAGVSKWLRLQLMQLGQAEAAWSAPQEVELAQDFDSILDELRTLDFISFTGDESTTRDLNDMRGSQAAAKKTHRALLALNDYARAKAEKAWNAGAFSEYLSDSPAGYATISKSILAPKESDDVSRNPKFRRHRELPMPDGRIVFMEAHIKLSAEATTSPRLHYYDDTGDSGRIVVGYIGAHLPNQQS